MPQPDKFPPLDEALLKKLDAIFPERSADPEWSDRKVWIESGKRAVVRFLWAQFKEQNESPNVPSSIVPEGSR